MVEGNGRIDVQENWSTKCWRS